MSALQGFGYSTSEPAVLRRLDQMCAIFRTVWGADSAHIFLVYQPFSGNPGNTTNAWFIYAQANGNQKSIT